MARYVARLEDTVGGRRDKIEVTRAMLDSAAASAPAQGGLPIIEGFVDPPRLIGSATLFRVEDVEGGAALVCDAKLDIDPGERVLAPSVTMTGERWELRLLRLVEEHKNPRSSLTPFGAGPP